MTVEIERVERKVDRLQRDVSGIRVLLAENRERDKTDRRELGGLRRRVDILDRWRYTTIGGAGAVSLVIGALTSLVHR